MSQQSPVATSGSRTVHTENFAPTTTFEPTRRLNDLVAAGRAWSQPLQRVLRRLPPGALATFSEVQLVCLDTALRADQAPHLINFQVSLPMLGGWHYLTIFFGRERRNVARLAHEGKLRPVAQLAGYGLVVWLVFSLLAATGLVLLYLLKCMLGIDLFPGPSSLHGLIFRT